MKQLSLFLIFIICLNTADLISCNRYREYEAPRIVHSNTPEEQELQQKNRDLEILNEEDNLFSAEKILNWIEEVNKKDIAKMKKEEIHHSLEGIKRASGQIQNYLKRISAQIEASINTIDLKVNEISIVDEKISNLKPAYKKELDKISKQSGSLLNALKKEKTAVDEVLKKLRKESDSTTKISNKSEDIEKKIELLDLSKNVKEKINEKLVSFMTLKNFEKAHKKLMTVVDAEMEKNFEGYKQYTDDKIAADFIVKNWSELLKQVEKEEEVVVESINRLAEENNTDQKKHEKVSNKETEKEEEETNKKTSEDSNEDNTETEEEETEGVVQKKSNKDKIKSNRKSQRNEVENESKDNTDDEEKEDEEDSEDEEEETLNDSESEFDQEYFNKDKEENPASFLEKSPKNKKIFSDA